MPEPQASALTVLLVGDVQALASRAIGRHKNFPQECTIKVQLIFVKTTFEMMVALEYHV